MRIALLLLLTTGCSTITEGVYRDYGPQAGQMADRAIAEVLTIGPFVGAAGSVGERADGSVIVGGGASVVLVDRNRLPPSVEAEMPEIVNSGLALYVGLEGSYHLRAQQFSVGGQIEAGWWRFTGGLHLEGQFGELGGAFLIGPEVRGHFHLGPIVTLMPFLRGVFHTGRNPRIGHTGLLGLALLFDLSVP